MKILLTAFAFDPCEISEPGAAWRFANLAARQHDVTVLMGAFPGPVERTLAYLRSHPNLKIRAVPFWPRGFPRIFGWKLINIHYWLWQRQLIRPAMHLHQKIGFDLVHHVTLSRYWMGSSACRLPVPLIWGPVGSGGKTPPSFAAELPPRARIANAAREVAACLCQRDPLLAATLRHARICFAMNSETAAKLRKHGVQRVEDLPQICFSTERLNQLAQVPEPPATPPIRLLSIGRLVYWKGFQYGIRACADLVRRGLAFEYRIVGWGPYESTLRKLIKSLGLSMQVQLVGRMTNDEIMAQEMSRAHVLLHPALHESFGNVCLEALASGRPVICLGVGGPASQITTACGVAVTTENPEKAVLEIASAVEDLAKNPARLKRMGRAAQQRAQGYYNSSRLESAISQAYAELGNTNLF